MYTIKLVILLASCVATFVSGSSTIVTEKPTISNVVHEAIVEIPPSEPIIEEVTPQVSEEEIALLALVTMAEAEGESEEGQRLVIDTILNRVDHPRFPDTITEVIYQPSQFSSMWDGRAGRCCVREDFCQLVREELEKRQNSDVIFFRTERYSDYGTPEFQVGAHYFSSY